jgi:hypothetical protein
MKRTTVSLIGMVVLLFAFSAPVVYAQAECNNDADCEDGLFCTVNSCSNDGSVCIIVGTPCEASETCDETNDVCVTPECTTNDDCFDFIACNGIETCVEGSCVDGELPCGDQECNELGDGAYECVECVSDDNCTDDNNPCNGREECVEGTCVSSGNPCPDGEICQPLNIPDVLTAPQADDYICIGAGCDNDTQCDDGLYCNGQETCNETSGQCEVGEPVNCKGWYCDEDNDTCVECLIDRHCDDEEFCNGQETCNEISGRCEDGEEPCEEPLICDNETESCVECLTDRDCGDSDTPYCDNETLSCVECLFDDDCDSSEIGPYCDDESLSCVECIVSEDCENDNETCRDGVCEVAACELKIRPKKVRTGRMFRPMQRRFKITSEEGYVPGQTITIDFGWLQPYVTKYEVTKKGKLKVWVRVPTGARLFKGPVEVIVNDCAAEVLFK